LQFQVRQQEAWQLGVERAARNSVRQQQTRTLMGELERMMNLPAPEPEVVYVEPYEGSDELGTRDFNVKAWMNKPRPWW